MNIMQIFAKFLQEDPKKHEELSNFLQKIAKSTLVNVQENFALLKENTKKDNANITHNIMPNIENNTLAFTLNFTKILEKLYQIKNVLGHTNSNTNSTIFSKYNFKEGEQKTNTIIKKYDGNGPILPQAKITSADKIYQKNYDKNQNRFEQNNHNTKNIKDNNTITDIIEQIFALKHLNNTQDISSQSYADFFQNIDENRATAQNIIKAKQHLNFMNKNYIPANMATTIQNKSHPKQQPNSIAVAPPHITINSNQTIKSIKEACEKIVQSAFEQSIALASSGYDDGVLY